MENSQKPHTKTIVGLGSCIVLLVLAVLGLVVAYYFQSDHVVSLESRVAALKTLAEDAQKEAKKSEEPSAAVMYREIPELGVKYKLTDQVKDLTYRYHSDERGQVEWVSFTTKELARLKDSQGMNPCADSMTSGGFTRQMSAPTSKDPRLVVKKIGNYYFLYSAPEVGCMVDTHEPTGVEAGIKAVKAVYDSLEAM